jgi:hypothetical protein
MPINAKDRFAELPPGEQAAIRKRADELYAEEIARRSPKGRSGATKLQVSVSPLPLGVKRPSRKLAADNGNNDKGARKSTRNASTRPQK